MNIPLRKIPPEKIPIRILTLSGSAALLNVPLFNFSILLGQSLDPQNLFSAVELLIEEL